MNPSGSALCFNTLLIIKKYDVVKSSATFHSELAAEKLSQHQLELLLYSSDY